MHGPRPCLESHSFFLLFRSCIHPLYIVIVEKTPLDSIRIIDASLQAEVLLSAHRDDKAIHQAIAAISLQQVAFVTTIRYPYMRLSYILVSSCVATRKKFVGLLAPYHTIA